MSIESAVQRFLDEQRVEMGNEAILAQQVPPRASVLRRAEALTLGRRNEAYGGPVANMADTAALWSAYLGTPVTGQQVAICMALVKIARLRTSPDHTDSHDDAAAYIAIAYECVDAAKGS